MHEYKKLNRLLQMIALLANSGGLGYSAKQLARRFDTTTRSIYRYFELLRKCGFELEKQREHRYRITGTDEIFANKGNAFTVEEAALVKEAVMAVHSSHPLHQNLLAKLFAHSELSDTAELIYNRILGKTITSLTRAMNEERQVVLQNYQSVNSQTTKDRLVEPIAFVNNMRYFSAYEPARNKVLQFKAERTGGVELLDTSFKHRHRHHINHPDAFGMTGHHAQCVELELSARAASLLREEFPLAIPGLRELDKSYCWKGEVKAYEGIGRFVLGLPGEVEINGPETFRQYVLEQRQREKMAIENKKIMQ